MTAERMDFPASDGLEVGATWYPVENPVDTILLCHRSHFHRGEYDEIAPRLNGLGYSCLAIDQRSGMKTMGADNETYRRAKDKKLATGYLEARLDVEAGIQEAQKRNGGQPVIVVGSSYSASLALLIAAEGSMPIKAVVAFSPGEYLKGIELGDRISAIAVPTLVLPDKKEIEDTTNLVHRIDPAYLTQFRPETDVAHGARALWQQYPGHEAYWTALEEFLTASF